MQTWFDLDGCRFRVARTASAGVVDADTVLEVRQRGERVWARYQGGAVRRGWLVGRWTDAGLAFRYAQAEALGGLHGGRSLATVERCVDGRLRLIERFAWRTRAGAGVNVFETQAATPAA
jgi:hypothetical protein